MDTCHTREEVDGDQQIGWRNEGGKKLHWTEEQLWGGGWARMEDMVEDAVDTLAKR